MTDYLYGLSLATQTKNFLLSLGFGFIMGIFYDLFRIIRISISKGKIATVISDILFLMTISRTQKMSKSLLLQKIYSIMQVVATVQTAA